MGLFGKLFDKKICSICGGEIGLLGNRKLEDGNLCKTCNAKLSPFFSERRHTTIEGIQEHLNYREENKQALEEFHPTRTLGANKMMYVDEAAGTFVVSYSKKYREENADVIPASEVADARIKVSDYKTEIKREVKNAEGKTEQVSFNPPRYKYHYNLELVITMKEDFKWFDRITIDLTPSSVEIEPSVGSGFMSKVLSGNFDPHLSPKYCEAENMGNEMIALLMAGRPGYEPTPAQPAESDGMVTCDYCGSKFTSDGSGKCPYCGANVY